MVTIAERKVPTMLPMVEIAYSCPATLPASWHVAEGEADGKGRDHRRAA